MTTSGLSWVLRPDSKLGDPIRNVPAGMRIISRLILRLLLIIDSLKKSSPRTTGSMGSVGNWISGKRFLGKTNLVMS